MSLTRIAVMRPLAVVAVYLAIALGGVLAYRSLAINLLPAVDLPVVSVTTRYPGAGPEAVELEVSRRIEDALAGLADLDSLTSTSTSGVSIVTAAFTERANDDLIATQVERAIAAALVDLPAAAERPTVAKADLNALPVLEVAVTGGSPDALYRVADDLLRPSLERVPGVGRVEISGGLEPEVRVAVDPLQLQAYGVGLPAVVAALGQADASVAGGALTNGEQTSSIRITDELGRVEDLGSIVIGGTSAAPVRVRDVATVALGAARAASISRVNGETAVLLSVSRQSGANTTDVADAVAEQLPRLRALVPSSVDVRVVEDTTRPTRSSLLGVRDELLLAIALTAVVLFLFLHSFRVSAIVLLSIPTTLLATLAAMQLLGFSFNALSTLGLTLTIGILVDDSIVVLENILRRLERGDPPIQAAFNGRAEIGLAAVAITLVDVVIFAPVGLVSGQVGGFFREFGFTIAAATLFSLLVSFTLTPTLAARLLRKEDAHDGGWQARFGRWWDARFARLTHAYARGLDIALRFPLLVLGLAVASLVGAAFLLGSGRVPSEFFPPDDQGIFTVATEAPPGTSLEAHDRAMREVERRLRALPEVETVTATVGRGAGGGVRPGAEQARFGSVTVQATPKDSGRRPIDEIAADARQQLEDVVGLSARVDVQAVDGSTQPVSLRIQGPDSAVLARLAGAVAAELEQIPRLRDVTNGASAGEPETRVRLDRARAVDAGVSTATVGQVVRTAFEGEVPTRWRNAEGREIDVRVMLGEAARARPSTLADLPVPTTSGALVRLNQVASVERATAPSQIDRRDRQRVVDVSAGLSEGVVLSEVQADIAAAIGRVSLPQGYTIQSGGGFERQNTAFGQLFAALGASIVLAYLLMAVLYNSFLDPLIILCAMPLAVGGAIGGLWVFGYSFSIFALIGLILLVGLAIKNGILLVDRANRNRSAGMSARDAVLEAGPARLRAILMTSLTIAVALAPTALRLGEGADLRAPLAAAVLGGVVSSTALTLFVVPVVYSLLNGLVARLQHVSRWRVQLPRGVLRRRADLPAGAEG